MTFGQASFNRLISMARFDALVAPQLANGDFIIAGDSAVGLNHELMLMRIDASGQTQAGWRLTTQPALRNINPLAITQLADGRTAVAGMGYLNQFAQGFVGILDQSGQVVLADMASLQQELQWLGITATKDSGLVVCGLGLTSFAIPLTVVARYDKQLNPVWTKFFSPGVPAIYPRALTELPGGGIVIAGESYLSSGETLAILAQLDAAGNLAWAQTYNTANPLTFGTRALHYDGQDRLYLAGVVAWPAAADQMVLLAIDTTGAFLWGSALVDPDGRAINPHSMVAGHGGAWVLHGSRQGTGAFTEGIAAAFSSTGSLLWAKGSQFDTYDDALEDVVPHADGGYLWLSDETLNKRLLKTDGQGLMSLPCSLFTLNATAAPIAFTAAPVTPAPILDLMTNTPLAIINTSTTMHNAPDCPVVGTAPPLTTPSAQVLPQPLRSAARIRLSEGSLADDAQLHISDLSGRSIALPVTRLSDGWEIQRGGLPAGIYAYQVLQDGQRIASGKLWVAD